jgi:predicted DsbA family dithiol-disulfide isomerase
MENKMKIEIWSDVVCPFCYIGKRKFETALAQFEFKNNVQVVWKSYQLMPDMPNNYTKNVYELLSEKYSIGLDESKAMHNQVSQTAKEVGLVYNFNKAIPVNTLKAHQFIQFAKTQEKQDEAEEALFRSYFTEGKNLNDLSTLLEIGALIGLDKTMLANALENGAFISNIQADIFEAQHVGVRGVPFFLFNGKYVVSGAQDPKLFLETCQKSFEEWRNRTCK